MRILLFCIVFFVGCYASTGTDSNPPTKIPGGNNPPPSGGNGQALFAAKCASCHGGSQPNKPGATEQQIKGALAKIPAMKNVKVNDAEIEQIADYLGELITRSDLPPEQVDPSQDGQDLYFERCASCHKQQPDIAGVSQQQIISALKNVRAMKNVRLDSTQAGRVAQFLDSLVPDPGTGGDQPFPNPGSGEGEGGDDDSGNEGSDD